MKGPEAGKSTWTETWLFCSSWEEQYPVDYFPRGNSLLVTSTNDKSYLKTNHYLRESADERKRSQSLKEKNNQNKMFTIYVLNVQSHEGRSIKHKGKKQQEKMIRIFIKSMEFKIKYNVLFHLKTFRKYSSLCLCAHASPLCLQTPTHLCSLSKGDPLLTCEKMLVSSVINSHGSFVSLFSNIHHCNNVLFNVCHS